MTAAGQPTGPKWKWCSTCKVVKPIADFPPCRHYHRPHCKKCNALLSRISIANRRIREGK